MQKVTKMPREITAVNGRATVIVDEEDFVYLSQFKWYWTKSGYISRPVKVEGKKYAPYMEGIHRTIFRLSRGDEKEVDHINGNKYDNRKANLRVCTSLENNRNARIRKDNTSGYKGVSWSKDNKKWVARSKIKGKCIHLGYFNDPAIAHEFYCLFVDLVFGEFANHGGNALMKETQ